MRGVWMHDETHFRVFDITYQTIHKSTQISPQSLFVNKIICIYTVITWVFCSTLLSALWIHCSKTLQVYNSITRLGGEISYSDVNMHKGYLKRIFTVICIRYNIYPNLSLFVPLLLPLSSWVTVLWLWESNFCVAYVTFGA